LCGTITGKGQLYKKGDAIHKNTEYTKYKTKIQNNKTTEGIFKNVSPVNTK
jgi:hypothetical protein